jgi:hypothetical protein
LEAGEAPPVAAFEAMRGVSKGIFKKERATAASEHMQTAALRAAVARAGTFHTEKN